MPGSQPKPFYFMRSSLNLVAVFAHRYCTTKSIVLVEMEFLCLHVYERLPENRFVGYQMLFSYY